MALSPVSNRGCFAARIGLSWRAGERTSRVLHRAEFIVFGGARSDVGGDRPIEAIPRGDCALESFAQPLDLIRSMPANIGVTVGEAFRPQALDNVPHVITFPPTGRADKAMSLHISGKTKGVQCG